MQEFFTDHKELLIALFGTITAIAGGWTLYVKQKPGQSPLHTATNEAILGAVRDVGQKVEILHRRVDEHHEESRKDKAELAKMGAILLDRQAR